MLAAAPGADTVCISASGGTWIWHNQGGRHLAVLQTFVPSQCSGDTEVHSVGGAGGREGGSNRPVPAAGRPRAKN